MGEEDVRFPDEHAERDGARSPSAHQATGRLRRTGLERAYAQAWDEWDASGSATEWEATAADRIGEGSIEPLHFRFS